jgi:ABC-type sugar transport system ATPase subunit
MGAGRTEIVETIFGKNRRYSGQVKVNGQALEIDTPRDAINAGIAYIPRERKDDGLVMTETVKNNMTLVYLDKLMKCGKLDLKEERSIVAAESQDPQHRHPHRVPVRRQPAEGDRGQVDDDESQSHYPQ